MADPKDSKEKLEKEFQQEDQKAGDDQSGNPRRDKYTTLYGSEGASDTTSAPATPETTRSQSSTDSTTSTSGTPRTTR